jgi:membrane protein insertase Oxa1/YidC/SpoIIIJ
VVRKVDGQLDEISYDNVTDLDFVERERAQAEVVPVEESGWIGFTDKYWMTTLIPGDGQPFTSVTRYVASADIYQTEARLPVMSVAPGATGEVTTQLFAGAKEWETIRDYQDAGGIDRFIDSIDWGWFYFLTKPMFWLLHNLNVLIGNMGLAIIALTVIVKAVLFPLAYKSYASMARMRELQPEMEKIKERAGDDRQKMQQLMMELYKKEKVNPASGCLPILLQIPIFFSLYKVIFVTLELRHAPFFGWLNDLSAPDSSSIINLFGLLPIAAPDPEQHPVADLHRRPADPARHLHVAAAEAEPAAHRPDAGRDLRLAALGLHVHAGQLRLGPPGLLDREQHADLHPAVHHHEAARLHARPLRQHPGELPAQEARRGVSWRLSEIWRHPIKGIGAERLDHVGLKIDRPLPMDRAWAVLEQGGESGEGWRVLPQLHPRRQGAFAHGDHRAGGRRHHPPRPSRPPRHRDHAGHGGSRHRAQGVAETDLPR